MFLILYVNVFFFCVGMVYVNKDCIEVIEVKELVCFICVDDCDISDMNLLFDFKVLVFIVDNKVWDSMKFVKEGEIWIWKDVWKFGEILGVVEFKRVDKFWIIMVESLVNVDRFVGEKVINVDDILRGSCVFEVKILWFDSRNRFWDDVDNNFGFCVVYVFEE